MTSAKSGSRVGTRRLAPAGPTTKTLNLFPNFWFPTLALNIPFHDSACTIAPVRAVEENLPVKSDAPTHPVDRIRVTR